MRWRRSRPGNYTLAFLNFGQSLPDHHGLVIVMVLAALGCSAAT
jgi:hypothetical protein